jgi:hypothetical protein
LQQQQLLLLLLLLPLQHTCFCHKQIRTAGLCHAHPQSQSGSADRHTKDNWDTRLPPCPQVLLLGCGDIRNALVTAAALRQLLHDAATPGSTTSENGDTKQEIQIHLNDVSDCILARDVLLLVRRCSPCTPTLASLNPGMQPAVAANSLLSRS